MGWRVVVVSSRAKIELKLGYLVIRTNDATKRILIDEISVLLIENTGCTITVSLLEALWKKKIAVLFCDAERYPGAYLLPCYGGYDSSAKIMTQVQWTEEIKHDVWATIVKDKIRKQAAVLEQLGIEESKKVLSYADDVESGDSSNREGHAAKVYFNALMGHSFSRADDTVINAELNYGYALILSAVCREIVSTGRMTQLGINHHNPFNKYNLGCDLMEPFRPMVDFCVRRLVSDGNENVTPETKKRLVSVLSCPMLTDKGSVEISYVITDLAVSLAKCARKETDSLNFPPPMSDLALWGL